MYLHLLRDFTSISSGSRTGTGDAGGRAATIVRAGVASKYGPTGMGLELELGFGYPAPGETEYPIQPGDEDRAGSYIVFSLRKAWTWHR